MILANKVKQAGTPNLKGIVFSRAVRQRSSGTSQFFLDFRIGFTDTYYSPEPGDLGILFVGANTASSINTNPGWTRVYYSSFFTDGLVQYKYFDGSEGQSITVTGSNMTNGNMILVVLRGYQYTRIASTFRFSSIISPSIQASDGDIAFIAGFAERTWWSITQPDPWILVQRSNYFSSDGENASTSALAYQTVTSTGEIPEANWSADPAINTTNFGISLVVSPT